MMASSCLSFEQTDLAAESRDRNHNNTLSSDCCPITPQHERQFATYECGVNDPRVCVWGGGSGDLHIIRKKCRFRSPKVIGFHYKSYNDQTSLPEFCLDVCRSQCFITYPLYSRSGWLYARFLEKVPNGPRSSNGTTSGANTVHWNQKEGV